MMDGRKWRGGLLCNARWLARACSLAMGLLLMPAVVPDANASVGAGVSGQLTTPGRERGFDVLHYDVSLVPDIAKGALQGIVKVGLTITAPSLPGLQLDAGDLVVDRVLMDGHDVAFVRGKDTVLVQPEVAPREGQRVMLEFRYHGSPKHGLEFHPERSELYTVFSTSQWMVSINAPDERATLDLRVLLPAGLSFVGTGREISSTRKRGGLRLHHWRIDAPVPGFVYGFAAGRYQQATAVDGEVTLRYFSAELDAAQLQKVFGDTAAMLRFFGDKSGATYRGTYSQALVSNTIGQEMAGLAVFSESYGRGVLEGRNDTMLVAHEVAHQWWGVGVTCQDWGHFWLNEGLANFMALAFMQQHEGQAFYDRRVEAWEQRVQKLKDDGVDKPLVFSEWIAPTGSDRSVVYIKGALAFVRLRELLGEAAFWQGLRTYTQDNLGRSTTTLELQLAMEKSSGRDLSTFFAEWAGLPIAAH